MSRAIAALLAALLVLAAGCGGHGAGKASSPGGALRELADAARSGDTAKVRDLLTPATPQSAASELVEGLGSFPASTPVVLEESIDKAWAVAALAGPRRAEGQREYGAFAGAFRLADGAWKVEIGDAVTIRPLGPDPGSVQGRAPTQIAAEFRSRAKIVQAGIWLDGKALAGTASGKPRRFTIYGPSPRLKPGQHVMVAFAEAGGHASALAWTFRVR